VTAAPVLSQLELRLLTSLAVHHRRSLKNCDVKQAFVQSTLPADEVYFLKPPAGCPCSNPNHYWRLIRSLYGLKRAPRLWFDTLCKNLHNMGLRNSATSPCLFIGNLIEGDPPIYIGIYVDDIIYFSSSDAVEKKFEELLSNVVHADFMGQVSHFWGIEFKWTHHDDGHVTAVLTQESFAESLIESLGFESVSGSTFVTPYRSGFPIDSVPSDDMSSHDRDKLRLQYQSLVGSLNWLAHTTRPDLFTVVSLLAQHQANPSYGHYDSTRYVVKYLVNTKHLGIYFTSRRSNTLESFLHFPIAKSFLAMSDANWGLQDATSSKQVIESPLFASRSMSAFYIDLLGPVHWLSK
jgi:hypothetical protein